MRAGCVGRGRSRAPGSCQICPVTGGRIRGISTDVGVSVIVPAPSAATPAPPGSTRTQRPASRTRPGGAGPASPPGKASGKTAPLKRPLSRVSVPEGGTVDRLGVERPDNRPQQTMTLSPGTRRGHYDGGSALHLAKRLPAPAKCYGNATVWRFPRRTPSSAKAAWDRSGRPPTPSSTARYSARTTDLAIRFVGPSETVEAPYFNPIFFPAASSSSASRRRFAFVSSRFAESIQPMYLRRYDGANCSKYCQAAVFGFNACMM